MNEDLIWLAENESYWADDSAGVVQISGGQAEYLNGPASQYLGVGRVCFTPAQWQAARDELDMSKPDNCHESPFDYAEEESPIDAFERECLADSANSPFTTPEEDEAWAEAEKRMDSIGQNGPTGEHYGVPLSKYRVLIKGQLIDVYDILMAYAVTNPADAHAIKKMLCPGQRGAKDGIQDRREAISSLERAIELEQGR